MSNRTIEITAKTEQEARGIADGELNDNEMITATEVLTAPARGLFGFVGKQEFKIRFIIGEKPQVVQKREPVVTPVSRDIEDDEVMPVRQPQQPRREGTDNARQQRRPGGRTSERNNEGSRRPARGPARPQEQEDDEPINLPERPRLDVSEEIKAHLGYSQIFELIRDVAANVGIEELEMTDYLRDGAWVIEASGDNVSQLIGKHGRTLDSLQYLMNIIFNKGNDDRVKLVLDVQGYREKRYRNLIMLANRMCRKALSARKQVELEPMSTLDRRTIHLALKDRTDIETFSKGTEPMRRVVITPVRKRKTSENVNWQPVSDEGDSDFSEKLEHSGGVPMFMEEDV
ncbi:MAG: KH domain-containing protein [Candidatus Riflebacteria bacterium]|nr:KH domain-containing protein [Candidatus Riflebacteria bacterium]